MKALLIIDMQNGSFTEATPRFDADNVVRRINNLARTFRHNGDSIIYIQHDGTLQNDFIPGTEAWALLPGLEVKAGDLLIAKTANDCFYHSALEATLLHEGITDLTIVGCATDFCVDATVKAALSKDYSITVPEDGHTTADRPGIAAEQVIAHYNWVWKNMLPTSGSLYVAPKAV